MGILTSRAALYIAGGIVNGGAIRDEPASGGGSVCGSLLGGKAKREATGGLKYNVGDAIEKL